MDFLISGIFWAIVFILLGVLILLNSIFNLNIPVGKVFFGGLIIIIGIMILTNSGKKSKTSFGVFEKDGKQYDIIFNKMNIDLASYSIPEQNTKIDINTVFASSEIRVSPELPMLIDVTSAFAGAKTPDGNVIAFGHYIYKTKGYDQSKPYYLVEAKVVFGEMTIIENK